MKCFAGKFLEGVSTTLGPDRERGQAIHEMRRETEKYRNQILTNMSIIDIRNEYKTELF